jgi:hypothetical protein
MSVKNAPDDLLLVAFESIKAKILLEITYE